MIQELMKLLVTLVLGCLFASEAHACVWSISVTDDESGEVRNFRPLSTKTRLDLPKLDKKISCFMGPIKTPKPDLETLGILCNNEEEPETTTLVNTTTGSRKGAYVLSTMGVSYGTKSPGYTIQVVCE